MPSRGSGQRRRGQGRDNIAGAVAARWLRLDVEARERTGVMARSHALRQKINRHIRARLAREGRNHGPAVRS